MARTGMQSIREIVEDILQGQTEVLITEQVLTNFIRKHCGLDPRTVSKYYTEIFKTHHAVVEDGRILISR